MSKRPLRNKWRRAGLWVVWLYSKRALSFGCACDPSVSVFFVCLACDYFIWKKMTVLSFNLSFSSVIHSWILGFQCKQKIWTNVETIYSWWISTNNSTTQTEASENLVVLSLPFFELPGTTEVALPSTPQHAAVQDSRKSSTHFRKELSTDVHECLQGN